ncbi:hypothetical protein NKI39_22045 [Mesorhizobium sp. M0664]|uniref:hypothetical protein n=1 Tax=Mesorhizobium sp. M0664 TaxID=2956982 RepID=UPI00333D1D50
MTQAGGPAAINGFLYQIIQHLGWLADVTLSGNLDGREIKDACLVLEPRRGGDARAEAIGLYLVEQYKTREDGTWPLAGIESVLSDLRKAVPPSRPANACYRFVTDGRPGKLNPFNAFLADLKSAAGPDDLDDVEKLSFAKDQAGTNREFFDHIVTVTRAGSQQPATDESAVVFHLLSHFEMEFGVDGSARATDVEKLLRRYAPDLGDERGIRERLIGVLVETLSNGEAQFDAARIDSMFRYVGLNPERLRKAAELAETMSSLTRRRLARLKYRPDRDVRAIPDWPEDKAILLIAGASGAGKTWQLGQMLEAFGQERQIATLVLAGKTCEDLLAQAARDVWQTGLGDTSEKSLVAVSHFLRELLGEGSASRLTVAIDDVQDIDIARDLVRQDWADWGMRLVLTVPQAVARALEMTDGDVVHVHAVGEFSVDELDRLLKLSGRRWTDLPPDLKALLRNPILAGLYLDLPYASVQSAPRSEYEIFEGFWARIAAKGRIGDEGIVIALAVSMMDGSYPLPRPMWNEIGLNDDAALRLDAAGWLRVSESGDVAFAHDRLLNWAVAKSLVWQYQRKQLTLQSLGAFLANESEPKRRGLGYVPMDTLWLLAADAQNSEALGQTVAQMEDSREFGSYGEDLYVQHLPTLGQRAVPILLERLKAIDHPASDGGYRTKLIGKAFANLARQDNVELGDVVNSLLHSSSQDPQAVAIAVLTAAPDIRHLNRLWEIHQQRVDALEDKTDGSRHDDYRASSTALRAGLELDPEWLRKRIHAADAEKEPVSELGYLLNGLEHPEALAIWEETKAVLMSKVGASKPRSLLYCIARFLDRSNLDFVTQHLSQAADSASGAALYALSILDPQGAIERLVEVEKFERYLTRNHWLPGVLRAQSELTQQHIRILAEAEPNAHRLIEDLFWERPDEMDEATLRLMLRALEKDLHDRLDESIEGDPGWLYHSLDLLGRIVSPELLAILSEKAGGELERMIAAVACSRLRTNSNYRDRVRESARRVLILMSGQGITTLVKRELESEHFWVRHGGLNWAFVRADDGIIERLGVIARRPVPRDSNGKLESDPYAEFHQSITALAALGADEVLVDILQDSGIAEVPTNLAELRSHRGRMPNALTDPALRILQSTAPSEESLVIALLIAWLSGDTDLIPAVRLVLQRAESEGKVALYACIALRELGDQSADFAQLALRMAHTAKNAWMGINALAGLGDRGLELLGNWLQGRDAATASGKHDDEVIRVLYANPATRKLSVSAAVDRCQRGRFLRDGPYDIAAEAGDPLLREQILDKAFAGRSFVTTEPLRAIEGLAKFDAARAVDAIELALLSHPQIERHLCRLLVRIAPDIAAEKLINAAVTTERDSLRNAAGRALRRLDPDSVSGLIAARMTGTVSDRRAAAELAMWLPIAALAKELGHLADHDSDSEVRHAALIALERHRQGVNIQSLLGAFPSTSVDRQWSLLVAVAEGADPYLLTDSEDPLWLGSILSDDVPAVFEHYANSALRQRKQKLA